MKWKNVDAGAGYYYITGTFVEWLPLLRRSDVREIICDEIARALGECGASMTAFVLMPDHLHILVYLPDEGLLHRFCKLWRGRAGRRVVDHLKRSGDRATLGAMAKHARDKCRYAVWKQQVRSLPVVSDKKLNTLVNYIHANPVRRGLVPNPDEWEFSSFRHYERGERALFEILRPAL